MSPDSASEVKIPAMIPDLSLVKITLLGCTLRSHCGTALFQIVTQQFISLSTPSIADTPRFLWLSRVSLSHVSSGSLPLPPHKTATLGKQTAAATAQHIYYTL